MPERLRPYCAVRLRRFGEEYRLSALNFLYDDHGVR